MIREEAVEQFLFDLNIPSGVMERFRGVAHMCGILSNELMVRMVMRLYDTSEQTIRNLVDPTYEWENKKSIQGRTIEGGN